MHKSRILAVVMASVIAIVASAQASESVTIEELYLQSETSMGSVRAQLRTGSLELQLLALRTLQDQVQRGVVDPNSGAYIESLDYAATRGIASLRGQPYELPDGYRPEVRMLAAELLGHSTDSYEAIVTLSEILVSDPEPVVRAQAVLALANIGKDPQQYVSMRMGTALRNESLTSRDERFIYTSLMAMEQLGEKVGMIGLHPEARESAVLVATGGFNDLLTRKAVEVIEKM